jgi:hypothetical protein
MPCEYLEAESSDSSGIPIDLYAAEMNCVSGFYETISSSQFSRTQSDDFEDMKSASGQTTLYEIKPF